MEKQQSYWPVRFSADVLQKARDVLLASIPTASERRRESTSYQVGVTSDSRWTHDSFEEFVADYRRGAHSAYLSHAVDDWELRLQLIGSKETIVTVMAPSRAGIERVFEVFEAHLESSRLPEPKQAPKPATIFIGHGRSAAWRDLKDHLHDQHDYKVIAYEVGARAGHGVRDILDDMMSKSSFALIVLTAEDETADGELRARQNVVHELGLFQGRLGFSRAIAVVEEGTESFSNIAGIQQIRFAPGHIRESFGDVLATIRREFLSD